MSPLKAYVVLMAFAAAGCARNAEVADEAAAAAPAIAASPVPAAGAPSDVSSDSTIVIPDAVVDANDLVANTPAQPVCRELLRPNSNVRTKQCMSAEAWELYDRAEAQRAGELVRIWQGGRYR
jgi:hypothetical protein